jgi:hypothetical protein
MRGVLQVSLIVEEAAKRCDTCGAIVHNGRVKAVI